MIRGIRRRLTYANVMSTIAMFMAMSGVAWAAVTLPKNSVGSKQLKNNAVTSKKIKTGQVSSSDAKDNTFTGNDINEGTLAQVPSALQAENANNAVNAANALNAANATNASTLAGVGLGAIPVGRADNLGGCNPSSTTLVNCATVTWTLPRAGRVFGVGDIQWHTEGDTAPSEGQCEMRVDGASIGEDMFIGEATATEQTDAVRERGAGHSFITGVLPAGAHTFSVACSEEDDDIDIDEASISTILLGSE